MTRSTLLVIAKEPLPGRVKTRLTPPCTPGEAASIAEAALVETLTTVAGVAADRHVVVLDGSPGAWLPSVYDVVPQVSGGLADRLAAAFAGVDGPAVLVGMDTPQLPAATLSHALRTVERRDAVLGLAADGGWWAIGLRRPDPEVFAGVPMSTASTGPAQVRRLRGLGLQVERLPTLQDVDHFTDALAVAAAMPGSGFAAAVEPVAGAVAERRRAVAAAS